MVNIEAQSEEGHYVNPSIRTVLPPVVIIVVVALEAVVGYSRKRNVVFGSVGHLQIQNFSSHFCRVNEVSFVNIDSQVLWKQTESK